MIKKNIIFGLLSIGLTTAGFSSTENIENEVSQTFTASVTLNQETDGPVSFEMDTERLHVRSIIEKDTEYFVELFSNDENLQFYGNGKPILAESTRALCKSWCERLEKGVPYTAMSIFNRDEEFIGYAILGYEDDSVISEEVVPGLSEFAIMIDHKFWGNGYAQEVMSIVFNFFAPLCKVEGLEISGAPLKSILFTTSPKNKQMVQVCKKMGYEPVNSLQVGSEENCWESEKLFFRIDL